MSVVLFFGGLFGFVLVVLGLMTGRIAEAHHRGLARLHRWDERHAFRSMLHRTAR